MKIIKLALALIFIAFAALQYNDPDPLLWMFIYGF
ncbi:MAG: transmembrane 220 family protein, partial [Cytophagales bacterium]|nr:transmembrane 220 family protein [Cytophagales bacterium]